MNDKTRSIVALSLIAGVTVGQPIFEIAKSFRQLRKASNEIKIRNDRDYAALIRTAEALKAEIADGKFEGLTYDEMMQAYKDRFEFEKIAIRLEN